MVAHTVCKEGWYDHNLGLVTLLILSDRLIKLDIYNVPHAINKTMR